MILEAIIIILIIVSIILWILTSDRVTFVTDCPNEGCDGAINFADNNNEIVVCDECGSDIWVGNNGLDLEVVE